VQVSVDIAEKYKDYSPERSYVEKKKRNKKEKSLSWEGTSTWGTPQLNSLGWIGTTTQGTPHLNSHSVGLEHQHR